MTGFQTMLTFVGGWNGLVFGLLAGAGAILIVLFLLGKVPLRYNVRNLTVRWKTTLLTALAFTLVISLLTVMLAFVNGMRKLTVATGQPGNVLVLAEGSTDEAFSKLNVGDLAEMENLPNVVRDSQTQRPMASRETYMIVNQPLANPEPGRPKRRFLQLRGIENPRMAATVHNLALLPGGNWFSEAGVEEAAGGQDQRALIQAVLGEGVARELGRDRTPEQLASAKNRARLDVGDTFPLGDRIGIVAGVMDSSGSTFGSEIWAKQSVIAPLFGKDAFTSLVLRTPDESTAQTLKEFLNGGEYKRVSVTANVETEYYANLSEMNQQFLVAIVFVAAVMSIGGAFGVMNTMFAAISQRIKDIGVLGLLGYSRGQILVSFLLESLAIALVGGLLGCALGTVADGWTATSIVTGQSGGGKFVVLKLAVDAQIIATGILLTLFMGGFGGLLPALAAVRKRPLDALR